MVKLLDNSNSVVQRLDNGVSVRIPRNYSYSICSCGAKDVVWGQTMKNKKPIPLRWCEVKGWYTHFADCPKAKKFRKKK